MNTIHLSHFCPSIFQTKQDIVSDIWNHNIVFEKGKTYLIEATSGTGKTSLFSYLCGYRNDYLGTLTFDQHDARELSIKEWAALRSRHISHMIQDLRLFSELTAYENIEIKNRLTGHKTKDEISKWLHALDIADKRDIAVGKMSFGQQQRVALTRALAQPFDFILADEPVSHLDDHNAQLLGQLMFDEAQKQGAGIIVTSIGKHPYLPYDKIYHL